MSVPKCKPPTSRLFVISVSGFMYFVLHQALNNVKIDSFFSSVMILLAPETKMFN